MYTNNEVNSGKITKPLRDFQLSLGDNTKSAPKYFLKINCLLAIHYSWRILDKFLKEHDFRTCVGLQCSRAAARCWSTWPWRELTRARSLLHKPCPELESHRNVFTIVVNIRSRLIDIKFQLNILYFLGFSRKRIKFPWRL